MQNKGSPFQGDCLKEFEREEVYVRMLHIKSQGDSSDLCVAFNFFIGRHELKRKSSRDNSFNFS